MRGHGRAPEFDTHTSVTLHEPLANTVTDVSFRVLDIDTENTTGRIAPFPAYRRLPYRLGLRVRPDGDAGPTHRSQGGKKTW